MARKKIPTSDIKDTVARLNKETEGLQVIAPTAWSEDAVSQIRMLRLNQLIPDPKNAEIYDTDKVDQLAKSIQQDGLMQPLVVIPDPEGRKDMYKILGGNSRYRACLKNKKDPVECVVRMGVTNWAEEDIIAVSTNIYRDMDTETRLREAEKMIKAYEYMVEQDPNYLDGHSPIEMTAERLGITVQQLRRDRRLMKLIPEVQELVETGRMPASTAQNFAKMDEGSQRQIVQMVEEGQEITRTQAEQIKKEYANQLNNAKMRQSQLEVDAKAAKRDAEIARSTADQLQKKIENIMAQHKKELEAAKRGEDSKQAPSKAAEAKQNKLEEEQQAAVKKKLEELQKQADDERKRADEATARAAEKQKQLDSLQDVPDIDAGLLQKVSEAKALIGTAENQLQTVESSLSKLKDPELSNLVDDKMWQTLKVHLQKLIEMI